MPYIEAVIFDWSGTLVDDLEYVWRANQQVFKSLGLPSISLKEFRERFSLPYWKFYESLGLPRKQAKEDTWKLFWKFFLPLVPNVKLFRDVKTSFEMLRRRRFKIGIVTQTSRIFLLEQLKQLGIDKYPNTIVAAEDSDESKPSSRPIILALNQLGTRASRTAYVGDMEEDILAAKRAGVMAIAINRGHGYHPRRMLKRRQPDYLIASLTELLGLL